MAALPRRDLRLDGRDARFEARGLGLGHERVQRLGERRAQRLDAAVRLERRVGEARGGLALEYFAFDVPQRVGEARRLFGQVRERAPLLSGGIHAARW